MDVPSLYLPGADCGQEFTNFTFNGYSFSGRFNMIRVSDGSRYSYDLLPSITHRTLDKPGGDGQYYFGTESKKRDNINLSVAFDSMNEENYKRFKIAMADKGIRKLSFGERPNIYYLARISQTPQVNFVYFIENGVKTYKGEGTISFVCYTPYQYSEDKSDDLSLNVVTLTSRGVERKVKTDEEIKCDASEIPKLGNAHFDFFQDSGGDNEKIEISNSPGYEGQTFSQLGTSYFAAEGNLQYQIVSDKEIFSCTAESSTSTTAPTSKDDVAGEFLRWEIEGCEILDASDSPNFSSTLKGKTNSSATVTQVFEKHRALNITSGIALLSSGTNHAASVEEDSIIPAAQTSAPDQKQFATIDVGIEQVLFVPNPTKNFVTVSGDGFEFDSNAVEGHFIKTGYMYDSQSLSFALSQIDESTFTFKGWYIAREHWLPHWGGTGDSVEPPQFLRLSDLTSETNNFGTNLSFTCTVRDLIAQSNWDIDEFTTDNGIVVYQVLEEKPKYQFFSLRPGAEQNASYDAVLKSNESLFTFTPARAIESNYEGHVYHGGDVLTLSVAPTSFEPNEIPGIPQPLFFDKWRVEIDNSWSDIKATRATGAGAPTIEFTLPELPQNEDFSWHSDVELINFEAVYKTSPGFEVYSFFELEDGTTQRTDYQILPEPLMVYQNRSVTIDARSYANIRGFKSVQWYVSQTTGPETKIDSPEAAEFVTLDKDSYATSSGLNFNLVFIQPCALVQVITEYPLIKFSVTTNNDHGTYYITYDGDAPTPDLTYYANELNQKGLLQIYGQPDQHYTVKDWTLTINGREPQTIQSENGRFDFPVWDDFLLVTRENNVKIVCNFEELPHITVEFAVRATLIGEDNQPLEDSIELQDVMYPSPFDFYSDDYSIDFSREEYPKGVGYEYIDAGAKITLNGELIKQFDQGQDVTIEWDSSYQNGQTYLCTYWYASKPRAKVKVMMNVSQAVYDLANGSEGLPWFTLLINGESGDHEGKITSSITNYEGILYEGDTIQLSPYIPPHCYISSFEVTQGEQISHPGENVDSPSGDEYSQIYVIGKETKFSIDYYIEGFKKVELPVKYYLWKGDYEAEVPEMPESISYVNVYEDEPFDIFGTWGNDVLPAWQPPRPDTDSFDYMGVSLFLGESKQYSRIDYVTYGDITSGGESPGYASEWNLGIIIRKYSLRTIPIGCFSEDENRTTADGQIWISVDGQETAYAFDAAELSQLSCFEQSFISLRVIPVEGTVVKWRYKNYASYNYIEVEGDSFGISVENVEYIECHIELIRYSVTFKKKYLYSKKETPEANIDFAKNYDGLYQYGTQLDVEINIDHSSVVLYALDDEFNQYPCLAYDNEVSTTVTLPITKDTTYTFYYTVKNSDTFTVNVMTDGDYSNVSAKFTHTAGDAAHNQGYLRSVETEDVGTNPDTEGYGYFVGWYSSRLGDLGKMFQLINKKQKFQYMYYNTGEIVACWLTGVKIAVSGAISNLKIGSFHAFESTGDYFQIEGDGILPDGYGQYTLEFDIAKGGELRGFGCNGQIYSLSDTQLTPQEDGSTHVKANLSLGSQINNNFFYRIEPTIEWPYETRRFAPFVVTAAPKNPLVYISNFTYAEIENHGDLPCFYNLLYGSLIKNGATRALKPFSVELREVIQNLDGSEFLSPNHKTILKANKRFTLNAEAEEDGILVNSQNGLIYGYKTNSTGTQIKKTNKIYNSMIADFQRNNQELQKIPIGKWRFYFNVSISKEDVETQKGPLARIIYHEIYW